MAKDYKQYDPPWNLDPFDGYNVWTNGCGGTAAADVLHTINSAITPRETCAWLEKNGYTSGGNGTYWEGIPAVIKAFGADCTQLNFSSLLGATQSSVFDNFFESIRNGFQGIMLMGNGGSPIKWCNSGHYVACVGYENEEYLIYDPASVERTGWHKISDFIPSIKVLYTTNIRTSFDPIGYSYQFTSKWLYRGSKGQLVKIFQYVWKALGCYKGKIDGDFGPLTEEGCKTYQKYHKGLVVDGSCGEATQVSSLGLVHKGYTFYIKEVKKGSKGESVKLLQSFLLCEGFYDGTIDGDFGPKTHNALIAYQEKAELKIDGVCGKDTWKSIIKI